MTDAPDDLIPCKCRYCGREYLAPATEAEVSLGWFYCRNSCFERHVREMKRRARKNICLWCLKGGATELHDDELGRVVFTHVWPCSDRYAEVRGGIRRN